MVARLSTYRTALAAGALATLGGCVPLGWFGPRCCDVLSSEPLSAVNLRLAPDRSTYDFSLSTEVPFGDSAELVLTLEGTNAAPHPGSVSLAERVGGDVGSPVATETAGAAFGTPEEILLVWTADISAEPQVLDLRLTMTGDAEINGALTGELQVFVDDKKDLDEAPPILEWD